MTQQFDEGVKDILLALGIMEATMYEANYIMNLFKNKPSASQQEVVQAVKELRKDCPTKGRTQETPKSKQSAARSSKEQVIYNKLRKGGLTHNASVGIIANLKAESKLDPAIEQMGGGPGRGLAQWEKGGRFDTDRINLVNFAKKKGKKWTDLDTQIDFILHELDTHPEYKRVKSALNSAKTPKEATLIFLKRYEKAGKPNTKERLLFTGELNKSLKRA